MTGPFDLPEGATWRELDDRDRAWLGSVAISLTIRLRRVSDGLERDVIERWYSFVPEGRGDLVGSITFQWLEGNYSCDCNRALFFARAAGEPEPEDRPCTDDQFVVVSPAWLAGDPGV